MNLNEATTRYDAAFREVPGLIWLPWVGHNFPQRPPQKRLLVVGESHYYWEFTTPEERQAACAAYLNDPQSTREQVSDSHISGDWTTKTLTNIPKLLFKTTEIDSPRLWGDSAYYNFVQRPMNYPEGERPTWDDFVAGWRVFSEVVRAIQPSHCLFIGVSAANSFDHSMAGQNLSYDEVLCAPKVDGVWPRVAKLEIAGTTTKLIFVHHLGRCKALSQWHDYLQNEHADVMNWLGAESYAISRNA